MASGSKGEIFKSKVDPCVEYDKSVKANSVMCTKCGKWVRGRCAKMKRVTLSLAKDFVCKEYFETIERIVEPDEELSFFDQVEFAKSFLLFGDRLKTSGGSEAEVIARMGIGWIKFRECGELLYGRRFLLEIKERIPKSCVRSAMLFGSETWNF